MAALIGRPRPPLTKREKEVLGVDAVLVAAAIIALLIKHTCPPCPVV